MKNTDLHVKILLTSELLDSITKDISFRKSL